MSVEFIGYITNNNSSETIVRSGPVLDPPYIETVAKAHEIAGFDRALLAFHSTTPDAPAGRPARARRHRKAQGPDRAAAGLYRADAAGASARDHRPVFRRPRLAACHHRRQCHRTAAGRQHARRQGRALRPHQRVPRYRPRRMDQRKAVRLRRQILQGRERLFAGEALSQRAASTSSSAAAPMPRSRSPASTPIRLRCGANPTRRCATSPRACAPRPPRYGRPTPRFSLSVRPILADTEEKAWAKADEILARATALQDKTGYRKPADGHATAGARRLLALAEQGTRIDKRLWTEIAKLTGANSNTTALVGTPEQVAEVFGDYYDLGISHFLIRGFDPLIDAIEYGRELIPLTRKLIAERQCGARGGRGMIRLHLAAGLLLGCVVLASAQTTLAGRRPEGKFAGRDGSGRRAEGRALQDRVEGVSRRGTAAGSAGRGRDRDRAGRRCAVHLRRRRQRAGEGDRRDPADRGMGSPSWCRSNRRSRASTICAARRSPPAAARSAIS